MADHRPTTDDGATTDTEDGVADDELETDATDELTTDVDESDATAGDLPADVAEEAERLTRLAREATVDDERAAYRTDREQLLAEREFVARIREEDDTLVLHPGEWVENGTIHPSKIDDTDRAVEIPLSGPGDPDDWEAIEQHNADVVETIRVEYGDAHAANARAFADFMGNHYARRMETANADEIREFLADYFPRNAWPSAEQKLVVEESIEHVFAAVDAEPPRF